MTHKATHRPRQKASICVNAGRSTCLSSSVNLTPKIPKYKPISIVGQGAFGVVYSARSPDDSIVAIKKVLIDPRYKNREYDILKKLNNINCVKMLTAFKSHGKKKEIFLNIVMEFLPMSLHQFNVNYRKERKFPALIFVRLFAFQMFSGLHYLHSIGITHRDMKPHNLLIDPETGELKICDFGSAKEIKPGDVSVSYIASRFYRAPELMLNCTNYNNSIDIWAAGCIIAEMLMAGTPLFPGNTSIGELHEIIKIIGPPSEDDLHSFEHDDIDISNLKQTTDLQKVLPSHTPSDILDLLLKIFVYDPKKRPAAYECMQHKCFNRLFSKNIVLPNQRPLPFLDRNPIFDSPNLEKPNSMVKENVHLIQPQLIQQHANHQMQPTTDNVPESFNNLKQFKKSSKGTIDKVNCSFTPMDTNISHKNQFIRQGQQIIYPTVE